MTKTAIVLTNKPTIISPLLAEHEMNGIYLPSLAMLNKALVHEMENCGILLDVRLVMEASTEERNKLFALAADLPTVRWRVDPEQGKPVLIDPLERLTVCVPAVEPTMRSEERLPSRLEVVWSKDQDPAMAETFEGVLLDISSGGAFLHAPNGLPEEDFLHLRILDLPDKLPIYCGVRWRRTKLAPGSPSGVGLKFVNIQPKQREEIIKRWLEPKH